MLLGKMQSSALQCVINAESSKGLLKESGGKVRMILEDFLVTSSERRKIIHENIKHGRKPFTKITGKK